MTPFDLAAAAHREMLAQGFDPDFPPGTDQQLAAIKTRPAPQVDSATRDLRQLLWSSIDNDSSRDLDQIEAAERTGAGIRILIGIADVDADVEIGSPIDKHAASQTTTVYTGVRTFPMLPEELSTDLTSLNEEVDRRAIVIEMVAASDGSISAPAIYRALVRNRSQLTYNAVGSWLESSAPAPQKVADDAGLEAQLRLQDEAATALRAQRHRVGALQFDRIEAEPVISDGHVTGIAARRKNRATELIEDFMIAANEVMARTLRDAGVSAIRRVVRSPERWPRIVELAAQYGEKLPSEPDSGALNAFLGKRKAADEEHYEDLSLTILKLLGPGEYAVARAGDPGEGHFGLAAHDYTHSTAPNRRFADMVTQRLIKAALDRRTAPYSDAELESIARNCTLKESAERKVERAMTKRIAAVGLQSRIGESFPAIVTGVTPKGTYVRVLNPPVEGRLVRGEQGVDVGDRVEVTLIGADPVRGFIDFACQFPRAHISADNLHAVADVCCRGCAMSNRLFILFSFLVISLGIAKPQSPLTCTTTAGNPPVRSEGITEPLGDIFLNCTGGTPGAAFTLNLSVFLNVAITNRISSTTTNATDVALTVDSGSGPVSAAVPGILQSSSAVSFNGITFTVPSSGAVNFHLSNLRGNVNQLGVGAQRPVSATISISGNPTPVVANSTQLSVGIPASGLLATLASTGIRCTGSVLPTTTPYTFTTLYQGGTRFVSTRVTEGFPGAFQPKTPSSDNGIRVIARYSGFPAGASIYVPTVIAGSDATIPTAAGDLGGTPARGLYTPGGGGSLLLSAVTGTDANGAGGTVAYRPGPAGSGAVAFDQVTQIPLSNGSGVAVYEVVDASASQMESAQFPTFLGLPPVPSNGNVPIASEQVSFAPVSTAFSATATDPIPRFVAVNPPSDCPQLADCNASYFPSLSVFASQPLQFTGIAGSFQQTKTVQVTNKGGSLLSWTASYAYQSGSNWLSVNPGAGVNGGTVLVTVYPSNIGPGTYTATLIIDAGPQAGSQSLPITFTVTALPPAPTPTPTPTPPTPTPTPAAPAVVIQSVTSAADPTATTVAAGSLAMLTGTNLQGKAVAVTFDGIAAMILSATNTSIEVQVPPTLAANPASKVQVTADAGQSAALAVAVTDVAPVIFPNGVLNQDSSVNSVSNPAALGSEIQIFSTGLMGAVQAPVLVKLNDRQPTPVFAGPAPGLIGVNQVNVVIPSDLTATTAQLQVCGYSASNPNQPVCSSAVNVALQQLQ